MDVAGWVDMFEEGGIAGKDEGSVEGGIEVVRERKDGRPG